MRSDQSHWFTGELLEHRCKVHEPLVVGSRYLKEFTDGRNAYAYCPNCKTTWNTPTADEAGWIVEKKED